MTDNEKASTFIEWRDGQTQCMYHRPCLYDPPCTGARKFEAPDMADPRNYMKALETVARLGHKIVAESALDRSGGWQVTIEKPEKWSWWECSKDNLAKAAIKTLAALYDAEHQP